METRIGCVIMASGFRKWFGSNKLLYELNGRPMKSGILDATSIFRSRITVTRYPKIEKL